MTEVVWTDLAVRDLEEIEDYISKDSIKYAKTTIGDTSFISPLRTFW